MTAAAIAFAVVALALLAALRDASKRHSEQVTQLVAAHTAERSELLTRIQRPEFIPPQRVPRPREPRQTDRVAMAQVGTVTNIQADGDTG